MFLHPTTTPSSLMLRDRLPALFHAMQRRRLDIGSSLHGESKTAPFCSNRMQSHGFTTPSHSRQTSVFSPPGGKVRLRMGGLCDGTLYLAFGECQNTVLKCFCAHESREIRGVLFVGRFLFRLFQRLALIPAVLVVIRPEVPDRLTDSPAAQQPQFRMIPEEVDALRISRQEEFFE